ncbi:hypothetical protein [Bacillus toyonensis]|uniref:hypothetical protein n=2 Tax=Bacillus TaxID=1386 RepID=UPI000BF771AB|nr:hypothetical protein [Bacillus toyonensis]PGA38117.1 hypothetical protein COL81_17380 [Bacillus toyonensis]PGC09648.1 hypothetical protein COM20_01615 [Bacillus toyonensis]
MVLDINRRTIKAMINMLMAYYSKHDIPMIHAYLKWYLDPNEQYNFIDDLEMTAKILKERNATFLIELISQHYCDVAEFLEELCNEEESYDEIDYDQPYQIEWSLDV